MTVVGEMQMRATIITPVEADATSLIAMKATSLDETQLLTAKLSIPNRVSDLLTSVFWAPISNPTPECSSKTP